MSTKYHVGDDGAARICNAKTLESCPIKNEDGTHAQHFTDAAEAITYGEQKLANKFGTVSTIKKAKKAEEKKVVEKEFPAKFTLEYAKKDPNYAEPTTEKAEGGYTQNAWVGSKRATLGDGYTATSIISKHIREEIKTATKAGYLPKGMKYSVKTDTYSGGSAIEIKVSGFPENPIEKYDYHEWRRGTRLKPEFQEVLDKVNKISDSYNYDDSDGSIDYFNRGFYGQVVEDTTLPSRQVDAARKNLNKIVDSNFPEEVSNDVEFLEAEYKYYDRYYELSYDSAVNYNMYEFTRDNSRMPNEEEAAQLFEASATKAKAQVNERKDRRIKENRRFSRMGY